MNVAYRVLFVSTSYVSTFAFAIRFAVWMKCGADSFDPQPKGQV